MALCIEWFDFCQPSSILMNVATLLTWLTLHDHGFSPTSWRTQSPTARIHQEGAHVHECENKRPVRLCTAMANPPNPAEEGVVGVYVLPEPSCGREDGRTQGFLAKSSTIQACTYVEFSTHL